MPAKYGSQDSPQPSSASSANARGGKIMNGTPPSRSGGKGLSNPSGHNAKYGLYGSCAEGTSQDDNDSDD